MLRILLICNAPMPEVTGVNRQSLGKSKPESWVYAHIEMLKAWKEVELNVSVPSPEGKEEDGAYNGVRFFTYPSDGNGENIEAEKRFEFFFSRESYDLIHVFGTEYPHSLAAVKAAEKCGLIDRMVISVQGLVSVIGTYHYYGGIPDTVIKRGTLRDFLKRDGLDKQRSAMIQKGVLEREAIRKAKHIIGRTDLDRAFTYSVNPNIQYHMCNESLRRSFYENEWNLNRIEPHSLFVSQSLYPLKGFHKALEALAMIKKFYPDTKLYTTGDDPRADKSLKRRLLRSTYSRYLIRLMEKLGLGDEVVFLGILDEKQMCERFLKSHVFILSSSIENSPNSLGEAMMLGVPAVASDVGGVKNMMLHEKEGLIYPFDEPYMLAYYVEKIFESDELALKLSENGKARAKKTHDRKDCTKKMLDIYDLIINRA